MKTPAEEHLVNQCALFLKKQENIKKTNRILNVGAGESLSIEKQIEMLGVNYLCDRVDMEDCSVKHPSVANCYQCSVESMNSLEVNAYALAFANFLLEHVQNLEKAASEIYRVLEPGGRFITTVPNPAALEMLLSKQTPLWFHKIVRRENAWKTYYKYRNINQLVRIFEGVGFRLVDVESYSFVQGYLYKFPVMGLLGRFYDKIVSDLKIRRLMGQSCITFEKS